MTARSTIQSIYDSLIEVKDLKECVANPAQNVHIRKCIEAMNNLELSNIGLDNRMVSRIQDSVCMSIACHDNFDIAVFIIPKGRRIPLHDHPEMCVFSKLLLGSLAVKSYSPIRETENIITAKVELNTEKTTNDPSWILTANESNIHEFYALSTSVVFDVLIPPYREPERPCNYYDYADKNDPQSKFIHLKKISEPEGPLPYTVEYLGERPITKK
jgi:cysteamine dioxygenase